MLSEYKKNRHDTPGIRFVIPVVIENIATVAIGLVFSFVIGGISRSSLAAVGIANSAFAVVNAFSSVITTGSAVLTARYVGKNDRNAASDIIEQSLLFSGAFGISVGVLCAVFAGPIMLMLMRGAEAALYNEAVQYFRVLMLSFPFLALFNTVCGILRASGDSRAPMVSAVIQNLIQIAAAYVLIRFFGLNMLGAGLAYLICRIIGSTFALAVCIRSHHSYSLRIKNIFIPHFRTIKALLSVGIPSMIESVSVQGGYLVGNAMIIGLGTYTASVYQVVNTIYTFVSMPQSITSAITITFVGQALGASDTRGAKRKPAMILAASIAISYVLGLICALFGHPISMIYSDSPEIQAESSKILWLMLLFILPAVELNAIDPALRAGGDTRFVMFYTTASIWLCRLPLTYLFCYVMKMGASGAFLANIVNLYIRSVFSIIRFISGKWMTKLKKCDVSEDNEHT